MGKGSVRKIAAAVIAIVPGMHVRIFLWRAVMKYRISYSCKIGWGNYIFCDEVRMNGCKMGYLNRISAADFEMREGSVVHRLNLVKLVNVFQMSEGSELNSRTSVVGLFRGGNQEKERCNFYLGEKSLLAVNVSVDVTDEVRIGNNVVFGGKDTQIWTHGFDVMRNMIKGPVRIGDNVYIGSRCTICQNVSIIGNTVIGAATCVPKSITDSGFYVSNELIRKEK